MTIAASHHRPEDSPSLKKSLRIRGIEPREQGRRSEGVLSTYTAVETVSRDWILVLLPTALAIKTFYTGASETVRLLVIGCFVLVNGLLVAVAYLRKTETRFSVEYGPLILIFGASALVLSRPSGIHNVFIFGLIFALTIRLSQTVDARVIMVSIVDGLGLYAVANVVGYLAGLRSPLEGIRTGLDAGGATRIIFPLSQSINLPPVLAAMYIVAFCWLVREHGSLRRFSRLICLFAAAIVLIGSGSRVAMATALIFVVISLLLPAAPRVVAPVLAVLASISALILPMLLEATRTILEPFLTLISNRRDVHHSIAALNGRDYIWERSLNFWVEEVNGFVNAVLGYGLQGHYKSGASLTYYNLMANAIRRDPEKLVGMHNSYLQQLYDGGLLGWGFLTLAILWASVRVAGRVHIWRGYAVMASGIFCVILACSMTEVLLNPNANVLTFWVLVILVGAVCQSAAVQQSESGDSR